MGSNPLAPTISTWYSGCATVSKTVESSSILLVLAILCGSKIKGNQSGESRVFRHSCVKVSCNQKAASFCGFEAHLLHHFIMRSCIKVVPRSLKPMEEVRFLPPQPMGEFPILA